MIEIIISRSKYLEWIKKKVEGMVTLSDMRTINIIPKELIVSGFEEAFSVIEKKARHPQFIDDGVLEILEWGSDLIDIKWIE